MTTRQRTVDAGIQRGRRHLIDVGREAHAARRDRGLSLDDVGRALTVSGSTISRIERAALPDVGIVRAAAVLAVVGLDLSVRTYPGGSPLRDAGHGRLLVDFRGELHRSLGWGLEVPFPGRGDQRAWDAVVRGPAWRYGVEAETHPSDGQALARRLAIKLRDGEVDGVLLLLRGTRHTRAFLAAAGDLLAPSFPVPGRRALELLRAGVDPGGNAIIVL
ncbi:MAG: helix-turn-helix transcriptional regulator [Chloroflexota bacterium]